MEANGVHDTPAFWLQRDQYKAAIHAALRLVRTLESTEEADLVAVNQAFESNVVDFNFAVLKGNKETYQIMEQVLKAVSLEIVESSQAAKEPLMEHKLPQASVPSMRQLLDLTRYLGHIQLVDHDIAEIVPVSQGVELFCYMEQIVAYVRTTHDFTKPGQAKLRLLALCNNLLSRLSRVQHVQLAGRIHLLLSHVLPTIDRSAVNLGGNVNEANPVTVEEVPEGTMDTTGEPVNAEFYQMFWTLQSFFQKPGTAIDPTPWTKVRDAIRQVLLELCRVDCTVTGRESSSNNGVKLEDLTVRFISSPKVLSLQVRDAEFRRHFLLQCLILLQAGLKPASQKPETPQFKIKQQGEAEDLEKLIYAELERTPENGAQFAKTMRRVMQREDQWAQWKADGATSFERDPGQVLSHQRPRKRRRLSLHNEEPNDKDAAQTNGAPQLAATDPRVDQQMNQDVDMDAEKVEAEKASTSTPASKALRRFLQQVITEMDPEEGIEEPYKRKREAVYKWEGLRQLSRTSNESFMRVSETKGQDLEEAVRLLYADDVPAGARTAPETTSVSPELGTIGVPDITIPSTTGTPKATTPEPADTEMAEPEIPAISEEEGELPEEQAGQASQTSEEGPVKSGASPEAGQTVDAMEQAVSPSNEPVQEAVSPLAETQQPETSPSVAPDALAQGHESAAARSSADAVKGPVDQGTLEGKSQLEQVQELLLRHQKNLSEAPEAEQEVPKPEVLGSMDDDVSRQPEGSGPQLSVKPSEATEIPVAAIAEPKLENGSPLEHVNGQPKGDEAKQGTSQPPLLTAQKEPELHIEDGTDLQQKSAEPSAVQNGHKEPTSQDIEMEDVATSIGVDRADVE